MLLHLALLFASGDPTLYRVPVVPQQWQDESNAQTLFSGINTLSSDGEDIYIADLDEPRILHFKPDGTFVMSIGGKGQGPGELGYYAPRAAAVTENSVWILSTHGDYVNLYIDGEFVTGFKTWHYTGRGSTLPAYRFAFSESEVVLPTVPIQGHLARVYNFEGKTVADMGNELERDMEFLNVNPTLNNTFWQFDGTHWYSLFFYRPILRKYNRKFEQVAEFQLSGPEIERFEDTFFKNEPDPLWTYPKPHFTDFVVFKGYGFIFSDAVLYQVDLNDGTLKSRTLFIGKGGAVKFQNKGRIYLHYLTFLDSGQLFLGHSSLYGEADVWLAEQVPYFD